MTPGGGTSPDRRPGRPQRGPPGPSEPTDSNGEGGGGGCGAGEIGYRPGLSPSPEPSLSTPQSQLCGSASGAVGGRRELRGAADAAGKDVLLLLWLTGACRHPLTLVHSQRFPLLHPGPLDRLGWKMRVPSSGSARL